MKRRTLHLRWRWFITGLYYGYPVCCVLRFACWTGDRPQGLTLGRHGDDLSGWVPCHIFHFPTASPADVARECGISPVLPLTPAKKHRGRRPSRDAGSGRGAHLANKGER